MSLKSMMKSWSPTNQGFLIECRAMERGITFAELYEVDEVPMMTESIPALLSKFEDVFDWPKDLPPRRSIEHQLTSAILIRLSAKGRDGEAGG